MSDWPNDFTTEKQLVDGMTQQIKDAEEHAAQQHERIRKLEAVLQEVREVAADLGNMRNWPEIASQLRKALFEQRSKAERMEPVVKAAQEWRKCSGYAGKARRPIMRQELIREVDDYNKPTTDEGTQNG